MIPKKIDMWSMYVGLRYSTRLSTPLQLAVPFPFAQSQTNHKNAIWPDNRFHQCKKTPPKEGRHSSTSATETKAAVNRHPHSCTAASRQNCCQPQGLDVPEKRKQLLALSHYWVEIDRPLAGNMLRARRTERRIKQVNRKTHLPQLRLHKHRAAATETKAAVNRHHHSCTAASRQNCCQSQGLDVPEKKKTAACFAPLLF